MGLVSLFMLRLLMIASLHQVLLLCWQSLPSWHTLCFHETNSWWQTQYTFPQLCQHKCRCGHSVTVIQELTELKNNLIKNKPPPPLSASEPWFGFHSHPDRSHANSCTGRCEGMGSQWHRAMMRGMEGWQHCKPVFTAEGKVLTNANLLP